jgi:hypothetical protein
VTAGRRRADRCLLDFIKGGHEVTLASPRARNGGV